MAYVSNPSEEFAIYGSDVDDADAAVTFTEVDEEEE
jgi:hypothetical protein